MIRQAILVGSGGHSRTVLSLLLELQTHEIIGIIDINRFIANDKNSSELIMGIPVLSIDALSFFRTVNELDVFLAIGDSFLRRQWWERIIGMGLSTPNLLSPKAEVHSSVKMGTANVICSGVYLGPEAILGTNNLINTQVILEHESSLGNHCHLAPRSLIAGRVVVGDSCFIGAGAVVVDGLSVAPFTTLGAGAVLVQNIMVSEGVYIGVPALRLESRL